MHMYAVIVCLCVCVSLCVSMIYLQFCILCATRCLYVYCMLMSMCTCVCLGMSVMYGCTVSIARKSHMVHVCMVRMVPVTYGACGALYDTDSKYGYVWQERYACLEYIIYIYLYYIIIYCYMYRSHNTI